MGPSPDDDDLHPGRILGPYELITPIGSGGMARVWAARHRGNGAIFALKMLRPHLAENAAFREMFFDEARIASRIHHENVARTFELVDLENVLTLVMEWVDGSSLVQMLRPGAASPNDETPTVELPLRLAAKLVAETCAGLHAAHELRGDDGRPLQVVHRDVSPHNVLVTRDGRVQVTDFGVAKAIGKLHMTIAGQVKGKLAYMSPEQLVGGEVDRRSDVFALGALLYETTTGRRPFQGDHDPELMAAIVMGRFVRPSEIARGYPRPLEDIVLRALAPAPEARYATAHELRHALEGWLAVSGAALGPPQIALLFEERCGAELRSREGLGLAPARPLPQPAPSSRPELAADSARHSREFERRSFTHAERREDGVGLGAGVAAVVVGLVLGLGVLVYVREAWRARALTAKEARVDASTVGATVDGGVLLAGDVDEVVPAPKPRSTAVRFRAPPDARLVVDGNELPAGTLSVARPEAGVVTVLVRAKAHADALYVVAPDTPDELEVVMVGQRPIPQGKIPRPVPSTTPTTPPNPYD